MGGVGAACVSLSQRFQVGAAHSQLGCPAMVVGLARALGPGPHQVALGDRRFPIQDSLMSGMGAAKPLQPAVCLLRIAKILNIHTSLSVSMTPIKNDLRIKETAMLFSVPWLDFAALRFGFSLFRNIFINNIMPGVS